MGRILKRSSKFVAGVIAANNITVDSISRSEGKKLFLALVAALLRLRPCDYYLQWKVINSQMQHSAMVRAAAKANR